MKNYFAIYFLIYKITVSLIGIIGMLLITIYNDNVFVDLVIYAFCFILVFFLSKNFKDEIIGLLHGNKKIKKRDIPSLGLVLFSMLNIIYILKEEEIYLLILIVYLFLILNYLVILVFHKRSTNS